MSEKNRDLTVKANRAKGDTRGFIRGGVKFPSTWSRVELTAEQVEAVLKEAGKPSAMLMVAENCKPADLIAIMAHVKTAVEVNALADAKPSSTPLQKAAEERLTILSPDEAADTDASSKDFIFPGSGADLLQQIPACASIADLEEIETKVLEHKVQEDIKALSEACDKRRKELED